MTETPQKIKRRGEVEGKCEGVSRQKTATFRGITLTLRAKSSQLV